MKNLKKVLALALAFALSLSLFAGAAFTDQADIDVNYADDVNMLTELGVLGGYPDGSFKPNGNITRAEFTKMAYTVKYGYDDQGKLFAGAASKFTDVEKDANLKWAKGYINYCSTQNIIGGVGNNKFNPNGNVTVAEASKMLLVILGCDPIKEGFGGANWIGNTVSKAMDLGVFDGWVGDPTAPATRQLVAKLMRNTIFAPTFVYNPITGVGSQVSPLDPTVKNETLGEKAMGLKHIFGLVVSNESYALTVDPDGENITKGAIAPQPKGKSQVYYEYVPKNSGVVENRVVTIDRALSDNMLGTLVDVYCTADGKEGSYANIKVIGNVIQSAKTVVHDVLAGDIKIMPNGKETSSREISPYISFKVNGEEKRVEQRLNKNVSNSKLIKVPNNVEYNGAVFADRMFYVNSTPKDVQSGTFVNPKFDKTTGALINVAKQNPEAAMVTDMGVNCIQRYRFVSVDGGETYSYIFRYGSTEKGTVSNYNTDRKTISVSSIGGTKDLNEVNIKGEIARGDNVITYMQDGKPTIEKAEIITGKASIKNDIAVINEKEYKADVRLLGNEISEYFRINKNNHENTQFVVYNGYIINIDGSAISSNNSDYAVVVSSTYDSKMGTAKVKLAFTDDTEGVFEVSKLDGSEKNLADFDGNAAIGKIYRYSAKNGVVTLSTDDGKIKFTNTVQGVANRKLVIDSKNSLSADTNSVMFLLYGGDIDPDTKKPTAVKAIAYKLNDMPDKAAEALYSINQEGGQVPKTFASYVEATSSSMRTLCVGAMSAGKAKPSLIPSTDTVAYLLKATYQWNFDTNKWYIDIEMIGDKGLIKTRSIDDLSGFTSGVESNKAPAGYDRGIIVRYKLNSDNILIGLGNELGKISDMKTLKYEANGTITNGFYYANISEIRGNLLAIYPYGTEQKVDKQNGNKLAPTSNVLTLEDNYKVIAIDNGEFIEGGDVETVSNYQDISATQKNAIIQVVSGKVVKIFSLHNEY